MAKIKLKAGKEAVEQSQGDAFEPPPPGLYHLRLDSIEERTTNQGNGKYLACRWKPVGSGREGTKLDKSYSAVWDNVSLTSEASEWSRARLAIALGAKPNRSGAVQLDLELDPQKPGSPVGTVCLGRVASDKDLDGNYRAKIGFIGPLEVTSEKDEAFSEDDEEEEDSPFEDEEEGEEEEGDLFTREDLENMENKELGQVAKDFEINTRDFVSKVKGKTVPDREGLIAAILEAQGIDEEEDDLSSDDDPF